MALLWFTAGILTTLAALIVLLPWLRRSPRFNSLPSFPWPVAAGAVVVLLAVVIMSRWMNHDSGAAVGALAANLPSSAPPAAETAGAFGTAAKVFGDATGENLVAGSGGAAPLPATTANAGSMDSAIASLQARLAKGGGTKDDWELLAKSFDFLSRPADAAKARAHQLPTAAAGGKSAAPEAVAGAAVSGEVILAAGLAAKAAAGETLFIVAKSVDSPGIPVAVIRSTVDKWPVKFTLDDSQSMMPGRNLSSAGKVTVEARISQKGQPLPAPGDLQGTSTVINPTDHQPLKITIDHVIS